MVLTSERLPTNITRKWPLVRVCTLVNQQVVRLGEMAATELANVFFLLSEKIYISISIHRCKTKKECTLCFLHIQQL